LAYKESPQIHPPEGSIAATTPEVTQTVVPGALTSNPPSTQVHSGSPLTDAESVNQQVSLTQAPSEGESKGTETAPSASPPIEIVPIVVSTSKTADPSTAEQIKADVEAVTSMLSLVTTIWGWLYRKFDKPLQKIWLWLGDRWFRRKKKTRGSKQTKSR
jgi:hypothetical protein